MRAARGADRGGSCEAAAAAEQELRCRQCAGAQQQGESGGGEVCAITANCMGGSKAIFFLSFFTLSQFPPSSLPRWSVVCGISFDLGLLCVCVCVCDAIRASKCNTHPRTGVACSSSSGSGSSGPGGSVFPFFPFPFSFFHFLHFFLSLSLRCFLHSYSSCCFICLLVRCLLPACHFQRMIVA